MTAEFAPLQRGDVRVALRLPGEQMPTARSVLLSQHKLTLVPLLSVRVSIRMRESCDSCLSVYNESRSCYYVLHLAFL